MKKQKWGNADETIHCGRGTGKSSVYRTDVPDADPDRGCGNAAEK